MKYIDINNETLQGLGRKKHKDYVSANPFPHMYFDNFFNQEMLQKVLSEFPDLLTKTHTHKYNDPNQVKLASNLEEDFGPATIQFLHFLNSATFLNFLSALTGIENLIPDPYFIGGGHHQILPGGYLKIHSDFNKHPNTKLDRRLNVLVYLNKDWDEAYGGKFELWDKEMKDCKVGILPLFNRMALFSTTDFSYHGHPNPLTCPPDRKRMSIALYYYTNGRPLSEINEGLEEHNTIFKHRTGSDDNTRRKLKLKKAVELITPPLIIKVLHKLTK